MFAFVYCSHKFIRFCDLHYRSICSDEIHEVDEISTLSSEDRIQELSPPDDNIPDFHSVTPPPPPSLKIASSPSLETPHDGKEQLEPGAPVNHPSESQPLASAFMSVGVSTAGTGLHVPGESVETQSMVWNTTVPDDGGVNKGSSNDWSSGTRTTNSNRNSPDVGSGIAAASNANGNRLGFREEQMMSLPIATATTADGVDDASDNVTWMDAVDAILGDADLEEILACDNNCRVDQPWTGMEFQKGGKD